MATAFTTELDAVNEMLSVIGESPVNTLENTGLVDVVNARKILGRISRRVQQRGWHFNTEEDYSLPLSSPDSFVYTPTNALRVDPVDDTLNYTVRGNRLYDKTNKTYVFTKSVKVNMVILLDFEELPEHARNYIGIKAARTFADRYSGEDDTHEYTSNDEAEAYMDMLEIENDTGDYNMFRSNATMAKMVER